MDGQSEQKIKDLQAKIDDVAGFVSLASHQLRSSPAIVRWYAELLLDEKAGTLTDDQKKYVNEIYAASQRMIDFINALLNVSRLELGTVSIRPEQVDVCAIAKRAVEDAQSQIIGKNLNLALSLQSGLPSLQADPKLLRLIIKNLLSNAIKFTPASGAIGLAVAMDMVDGKSNAFKITVSDSGAGIPKAEQVKIFTKLFHATPANSETQIGTGLGLYIVKSILDQTGGSIHFTSEESKGSIFEVFLPLGGMKERLGGKVLDV